MSGRADLDRVSEIIGDLYKIAAEVDKKKEQLVSQENLEEKEHQEYLKKIDKEDEEDEAQFQKLALERKNRRKKYADRQKAATEGREKARLAHQQDLSRIQGEYPRPADHPELRMLLMKPGAGATSLPGQLTPTSVHSLIERPLASPTSNGGNRQRPTSAKRRNLGNDVYEPTNTQNESTERSPVRSLISGADQAEVAGAVGDDDDDDDSDGEGSEMSDSRMPESSIDRWTHDDLAAHDESYQVDSDVGDDGDDVSTPTSSSDSSIPDSGLLSLRNAGSPADNQFAEERPVYNTPQKRRMVTSAPGDCDSSEVVESTPKRRCTRFDRETDMTYDEVYRRTRETADKNKIVEHPKDSNNWYIVPCRWCGKNWNGKACPLRSAQAHLKKSKDHPEITDIKKVTYDTVIEFLGIRVHGCDDELALQNDLKIMHQLDQEEFDERGIRRTSVGGSTTAMSEQSEMYVPQPGGGDTDVDDHNREAIPMGKEHPDLLQLPELPTEDAIWDPVVGEVYQFPWDSRVGDHVPVQWHYVTRLPLYFEDIGITGNVFDSGLWDQAGPEPKKTCAEQEDGDGRIRLVWRKGFEDGGSRVRDRMYPLLFLQAGLQIPPAGQGFWLPERGVTTWEKVKYLRPEDYRHPPEHDTRALEEGLPAVEAWKSRLRANRGGEVVATQDHPAANPDTPATTNTPAVNNREEALFGSPLQSGSPAPVENSLSSIDLVSGTLASRDASAESHIVAAYPRRAAQLESTVRATLARSDEVTQPADPDSCEPPAAVQGLLMAETPPDATEPQEDGARQWKAINTEFEHSSTLQLSGTTDSSLAKSSYGIDPCAEADATHEESDHTMVGSTPDLAIIPGDAQRQERSSPAPVDGLASAEHEQSNSTFLNIRFVVEEERDYTTANGGCKLPSDHKDAQPRSLVTPPLKKRRKINMEEYKGRASTMKPPKDSLPCSPITSPLSPDWAANYDEYGLQLFDSWSKC